MPILVFDTETTGKYEFKKGMLDPCQPRIVSLAALAMSDDGQTEVGQYYAIVKPDDFVIPEEVSRIHGITQEFAMKNGFDGKGVINSFLRMFVNCRYSIAFNSKFDFHMVMSEIVRRCPDNEHLFDIRKVRCAMLAAAGCMKKPNQYGYESYAWPKLQEAYAWMFKQNMEGAHNAMADVRATAWLSFAMIGQNYWNLDEDRVLI